MRPVKDIFSVLRAPTKNFFRVRGIEVSPLPNLPAEKPPPPPQRHPPCQTQMSEMMSGQGRKLTPSDIWRPLSQVKRPGEATTRRRRGPLHLFISTLIIPDTEVAIPSATRRVHCGRQQGDCKVSLFSSRRRLF